MRKVFLDDLPHRGKLINWAHSIGYEIKFIYEDIVGLIKIVKYESNKLTIIYNNNPYYIIPGNLLKVKIGTIIGKIVTNYRYKINDEIETNTGTIKIIEYSRIKYKNNISIKSYKYKCLIDGYEGEINENNLLKHKGCTQCAKRSMILGYNDINTLHPDKVNLFLNKEDTVKYTPHSGKYVNFKCPICENIIQNKRIINVMKDGLKCPKCSDGFSYPNKFMFNILYQIKNLNKVKDFETEKVFDWLKFKFKNKLQKGFIDFYLIINNKGYGVEMDGGFHSKDNKMNGQTKEESKYIDDEKDRLCSNHDIKVIRVKSLKSELEYIKNKVLQSELPSLLDFKEYDIDWKKCHEYACSSLVKKACDLWEGGMNSTSKIALELKISSHTARKYLKQGTELGFTKYDPVLEFQKTQFNKEIVRSKVICLNTEEVFDSIKKASQKYDIFYQGISQCCRNEIDYSGIHPLTKEYLQWQYYEEYCINPKEILSIIEIKTKLKNRNTRKIICLNNFIIFNSLDEAAKWANLKHSSSICKHCKGEQKSTGKHPITKEPLKWQYYDEYIKSSPIHSQPQCNHIHIITKI